MDGSEFDRETPDAFWDRVNAEFVARFPKLKPTSDDICHAIYMSNEGRWLDPVIESFCWYCEMSNAGEEKPWTGLGYTPGSAMGMAWLNFNAPDHVLGRDDDLDWRDVPFEIGDEFSFKLMTPREFLRSKIWLEM